MEDIQLRWEYLFRGQTYSGAGIPSSSDWLVSSSEGSLRRSQGRMAVESASSSTGAMLGRRLPAPFSVGSASLLLSPAGSGFCRSMATVPVVRYDERERVLSGQEEEIKILEIYPALYRKRVKYTNRETSIEWFCCFGCEFAFR